MLLTNLAPPFTFKGKQLNLDKSKEGSKDLAYSVGDLGALSTLSLPAVFSYCLLAIFFVNAHPILPAPTEPGRRLGRVSLLSLAITCYHF